MLYEEQLLYEIRRAIDDAVITSAITVPEKLVAADTLYRDFLRLYKACTRMAKCIMVPRVTGSWNAVARAAQLHRALVSCTRQRHGQCRGIRLGRLGEDLKLVAAAELARAHIVTRDAATLYRAYQCCLHRHTRAPGATLLEIDEAAKRLGLRSCGQTPRCLEEAAREAATRLGLSYRGTTMDC